MAAVIGAATLAIWVYLLLFRGGFWWLPYRRTPIAANIGWRSVVAVIPARDEAAVIGCAVASLLAQDYDGNLRIVVVDDQSSDGTAQAVRTAANMAEARDRVTICCGKPVPAGWTGKLWAMSQGIASARLSRPEYFLLTDADIVHDPGNLRALVSHCETSARKLPGSWTMSASVSRKYSGREGRADSIP